MRQADQIKEIKNIEAWADQILFWRSHLDVFIEDYFQIKLTDVQKVIARSIGNCDMSDVVQSRGAGKTWLISICGFALAVLYPGSMIAVASGTAEQATLILQKLDDKFLSNPNVMREIECAKHKPVIISRSKSECFLKNGSKIRSYSVGTLRGQRAKIVIIDEAPEVKEKDLQAIIGPIRNETRQICFENGCKDYNSKLISITSACLKSNYFFRDFSAKVRDMRNGDEHVFACALNYEVAVRTGITPLEFFESERKRMPEPQFQMEYGSLFLGAEAGSWFPYEVVEPCRVLEDVEIAAPAKSQSQYVIGLDLATSAANIADNAIICVIKLVERPDGSYLKKLVNLRSFHGKKLDFLATEVRKMLIRFPNTIRVVFDHRGLGDALPQFLNKPWTDPETGKEYPPLVLDDEISTIKNAKPLLRSVIASAAINQNLATSLRVAFEQHMIEIPISSRRILNGHVAVDTDDEEESVRRSYTQMEKAIFVETDALQIELGNIVAKVSTSGTYTYDTAKTTQHKDRYSSLAMAVWFITQQEEERKALIARNANTTVIGVVGSII